MRVLILTFVFLTLATSQAYAVKVKGKYLREGDIVCKSAYDVGLYSFHRNRNHNLSTTDLLNSGVCWKIKRTKNIIAIAKKAKKHTYCYSINLLYWHNGKKINAYTDLRNIR